METAIYSLTSVLYPLQFYRLTEWLLGLILSHSFHEIALYCLAALGLFDLICFIIITGMDKGMEVLRKAREHYLEIKSWKAEQISEAVESSTGLKIVSPPKT